MNGLSLKEAARLLKSEEVVAIPTETVYGLAGNIYSDKAIKKIYALKQRPAYNPLIVHVKSIQEVEKVAQDIPPQAYTLAQVYWPGPLTLVLPRKPSVSDLITAGGNRVAVRMPKHPLTLELLEYLDFPLAAPSANPSNYLSPTSPADVLKGLPLLEGKILNGGLCQAGIESTVVGFEDNELCIYRPGVITADMLEASTGLKVSAKQKHVPTLPSPGMMAKHYAPRTSLIVSTDLPDLLQKYSHKKLGVLSFKTTYELSTKDTQLVLSEMGDLQEAARNFFAALHYLDALDLDLILAEPFPEAGIGVALNDRLNRAVAH